MQASMFNVRVPLDEIASDVFLMNTFTDAQLIVSRDVVDLLDRLEWRRPRTRRGARRPLEQLAEHGFVVADRERERARPRRRSSATCARAPTR